MATTRRDTTSLGKERRGISPSSSHITPSQRSTKQSNDKQVPNYLKPTVSSRTDALKNAKKTGPEDATAQKARRGSLDKPPSAARLQKALTSPGPRDRTEPPRDKPTTARSTSFSSRSSTAPKPTLERASKTAPKATKPQIVSPLRTVKKTTTPNRTRKETTLPSASKKLAASTHETKQALNPEAKHENEKEPLVHDVEETVKVESHQHQLEAPEIPKSEEKEHLNVEQHAEVNSDDIQEVNEDVPCDISTVPAESNLPQIEENEDILEEEGEGEGEGEEEGEEEDEETDALLPESEENHSKEEINDDEHQKESSSIAEANADQAEEKAEDNSNATEEVAAAAEVINPDEIKVEGDHEGSENVESKEVKEVENQSVEESKPEPAAVAAAVVAKRPAVQGKKESPTAYNAVIEETASKLLEKRKNKVRALVGAFETVIDYESAASK